LLATGVYESRTFNKSTWPATELAWPIRERLRFEEVTRQTVIEAGVELGLSQETAIRLLDEQVHRIGGLTRDLLASIEQENAEILDRQPSLASEFAGESRCLRAITEVVIKEMAEKLAR
jgi:serine/threonine-protein kinase HipA